MKYIKKFESIELPKLKKYVIWQDQPHFFDIYVVFEVLNIYREPNRKNVEERIFFRSKRHAIYDGLNKKLTLEQSFKHFVTDRPYKEKEILYESDNLQDCINVAKLMSESKKFNI